MSRLEDELWRTLRRLDPPAGFADRVMARASQDERTKSQRLGGWPSFSGLYSVRWALAGALCLVLLVGGILFRDEQQKWARGEAAKEQLLLALRITASKLQMAEQNVRQVGSADQPPE